MGHILFFFFFFFFLEYRYDLGARKGAQSFMGLLGFVGVIRPQLRQGSFTLRKISLKIAAFQ